MASALSRPRQCDQWSHARSRRLFALHVDSAGRVGLSLVPSVNSVPESSHQFGSEISAPVSVSLKHGTEQAAVFEAEQRLVSGAVSLKCGTSPLMMRLTGQSEGRAAVGRKPW